MLFSNDQVAAFVANNFEPCWEMVRPVPIIRIDFGNGTVITRTLHGNIASYVCSSDGQVLDILPGIYNPNGYLAALDQLRLLAQFARSQPEVDKRTEFVRAYHQRNAAALQKGQEPQKLIDLAKIVPVYKGKIERPIERIVRAVPAAKEAAEAPKFDTPEDVANWKALAEDTQLNEKVRRLQIHEFLVKSDRVKPEKMTKWLYKEVLHADLDDPYLGLGPALFASYPFAKEDGKK